MVLSDSSECESNTVLEMLPKKRSAPPTDAPSDSGKRKQRRRPQLALLQGQRVLVVPIGVDVSRKRAAIWQKLVEKLGGTSVAGTNPLHKHPTVDWHHVDCVVASAQVGRQKACAYYQTDTSPPLDVAAHVRVFTPEWLAYLVREKQFPVDDDAFQWTHLRDQLGAEHTHR